MVSLSYPFDTFERLVTTMDQRPEQVGFMLARDIGEGVFRVSDLRLVPGHRFASRDDDHAETEDAIRGEMIQWAWNDGGCLVEAHSHGHAFTPARFSRFDFSQFEVWVPHVRWRLQRRPYLALVTAGSELDGLAWIDERAVAIEQVLVDGLDAIQTTRESLAYLETRDGR